MLQLLELLVSGVAASTLMVLYMKIKPESKLIPIGVVSVWTIAGPDVVKVNHYLSDVVKVNHYLSSSFNLHSFPVVIGLTAIAVALMWKYRDTAPAYFAFFFTTAHILHILIDKT